MNVKMEATIQQRRLLENKMAENKMVANKVASMALPPPNMALYRMAILYPTEHVKKLIY